MGAGHNAYLIEYIQNNEEKQIVFGGDTAYTHAFKKRHDKSIDVAIMPI
jgi:L-ascorbate metabolism protein UlaG (beta-lactamase superfamily)